MNWVRIYQDRYEQPPAVCHKVKPVGKPDAVVPQVRFDEQGREAEPSCHRARPRLYYMVYLNISGKF